MIIIFIVIVIYIFDKAIMLPRALAGIEGHIEPLHEYSPSIVRLPGCWWRVLSPAGFLPVGYPARERKFGQRRNRKEIRNTVCGCVCLCVSVCVNRGRGVGVIGRLRDRTWRKHRRVDE